MLVLIEPTKVLYNNFFKTHPYSSQIDVLDKNIIKKPRMNFFEKMFSMNRNKSFLHEVFLNSTQFPAFGI